MEWKYILFEKRRGPFSSISISDKTEGGNFASIYFSEIVGRFGVVLWDSISKRRGGHCYILLLYIYSGYLIRDCLIPNIIIFFLRWLISFTMGLAVCGGDMLREHAELAKLFVPPSPSMAHPLANNCTGIRLAHHVFHPQWPAAATKTRAIGMVLILPRKPTWFSIRNPQPPYDKLEIFSGAAYSSLFSLSPCI